MSNEQGEQTPAVDQILPEASPVEAQNVESPDAPIQADPIVDADSPAPEPVAPVDPDPLPPPVVETIEETIPEPEATPEPANAFLNQVGRGGVYIREMGGACRQMVACTLIGVRPDGTTRIRLGQAPGVRESEIVATYSEQHVPGTWHWA